MTVGLPAETIERLKGRLAAGREAIATLAQRTPAGEGLELVRRITALVDELIAALVGLAADRLDGATVAVIALGGYGREELCPQSDIDLLFVTERRDLQPFVDAVLYGLWDLGFEVGHAVRSIEDTMAIATEDQSVMTALLDARLIAIGDGQDGRRKEVFSALIQALEDELFGGGQRVQQFIDQKLDEAQRRRSRYGNSVYLLEPNVKESEGGLRELHTAMWVAHARWRVRKIRDLLHVGVLSSREERAIERAYGFLLRVRTELHLVSGRRQDSLSFAHQETIAERLDFTKDASTQSGRKFGVERFMRAYYFNARQLRIQAQSIIERATSHRVRRAMPKHAPGGFKLWQGMLTVSKRSQFEEDPTALVRIFDVAQEEDLEIYSYTKDLISSSVQLLDRAMRRDGRVVGSFLRTLEDPKSDGSILDVMHDLGLLRRLIPEVSRMTARWQHSLYHVYTVDAHSIFVVKNLKGIRRGTFRDTPTELTRMMAELPRPAVVYMAGFLHDIGKGWRHGDHSKRGARVAQTVGRRFEEAGLSVWTEEETADLVWLVEEHLTMSTMSQRRDVSDRSLLESFAEDVLTHERLVMLYALTVADMKGTSPKVWTDWKASLLAQLYRNTKVVLDEVAKGRGISVEAHEQARRVRAERALVEEAPDLSVELVQEFIALMPTRYIMTFGARAMAKHLRQWRGVVDRGGFSLRIRHQRRDGITMLTIVCPDRPGLLSMLAGTLAANSLRILSAQIFSVRNRMALDILYVKDADGALCDDPARWSEVEADLTRIIAGEEAVENLVQTRLLGSTLQEPHRPDVETKLMIANDLSPTETVIDVFCQDHLGALYTISKTLADQGLSISLAKISTEGDRVADGFYVTDVETGEKVTDPARHQAILEALTTAVSGARARRPSQPGR